MVAHYLHVHLHLHAEQVSGYCIAALPRSAREERQRPRLPNPLGSTSAGLSAMARRRMARGVSHEQRWCVAQGTGRHAALRPFGCSVAGTTGTSSCKTPHRPRRKL